MAARRRGTTKVAVAVMTVMVVMVAVEAEQNCICECVKLCARTSFPDMEECEGKCKERSCVRSCEEACISKGYPRLPQEGIPSCEIEPLTPEEKLELRHNEQDHHHGSATPAAAAIITSR